MDPLITSSLISSGGGLLSSLLGKLFGGNSPKELARFDPETQKLFMSRLQSALQGNSQGFQPIENQARENFQSKTIPSLAERFTAMGGGQRSSEFQGMLGQHATDFEGQLAALKGQFGQNEISQLMPFAEKEYQTNQSSGAQNFIQGLMGGTNDLAKMYALQQMLGQNGQGSSSAPQEAGSDFVNVPNMPQSGNYNFRPQNLMQDPYAAVNRLGGGATRGVNGVPLGASKQPSPFQEQFLGMGPGVKVNPNQKLLQDPYAVLTNLQRQIGRA